MKPLLFNTDMVKAILDGRKTVTRRLVKEKVWKDFVIENGKVINYLDQKNNTLREPLYGSSYKVGDIIYVRETWGIEKVYGNVGTYGFDAVYKADEKIIPVIIKDFERYTEIGKFFDKTGWIPSLFMPKEAARIFLRVTDVRVERLQDINGQGRHDEFLKEGYPFNYMAGSPLHDFVFLWNSTIKKADLDKYDWHANPWVWVIEFERIEKPEGDL